jgi:hypothetical protein
MATNVSIFYDVFNKYRSILMDYLVWYVIKVDSKSQ